MVVDSMRKFGNKFIQIRWSVNWKICKSHELDWFAVSREIFYSCCRVHDDGVIVFFFLFVAIIFFVAIYFLEISIIRNKRRREWEYGITGYLSRSILEPWQRCTMLQARIDRAERRSRNERVSLIRSSTISWSGYASISMLRIIGRRWILHAGDTWYAQISKMIPRFQQILRENSIFISLSLPTKTSSWTTPNFIRSYTFDIYIQGKRTKSDNFYSKEKKTRPSDRLTESSHAISRKFIILDERTLQSTSTSGLSWKLMISACPPKLTSNVTRGHQSGGAGGATVARKEAGRRP